MRRRRRSLACALAAAAVLAGCGEDEPREEPGATTPPPVQSPQREEEKAPPAGTGQGEPAPEEPPLEPGSPEQEEGGAGDEEPIRTEATLTGRGGRIRPAVVRVPAFIAVRLVLSSGDGDRYGLRVGGRTLTAVRGRPATLDLDGLPPGRSHAARAVEGASGTVRIVATAEPGP